MAKRGLGKGLGALLPAEDILSVTPVAGEGVLRVDIGSIAPNPKQPRREFDEEKIRELADSIREHGVLQPLVLRATENGYELIMGERRLRAAKAAGLEKVPAILREVTEQQMAELALIENLQREDLTPLEEAQAYRAMMDEYGYTQDELARLMGKSRSAVANSLRLLSLNENELTLLAAGELTAGHARALLSVREEDGRVYLAKEIVSRALSVRQAEDLARRLNEVETARGPKIKRPKFSEKTAYLRRMEDNLRIAFGTKVAIHASSRGGKIEIDYYSEEDLNRILTLLVAEEESLKKE